MRRARPFVVLLLCLLLCAPAYGLEVKILAVNDFHGQLQPKNVDGRPAGGAAVLAAWLRAAESGREDHTVIALAGDAVGASPADSALLRDEPAIMVWNGLANQACRESPDRMDPRCNMVATVGNHEFDKGRAELLRLIRGGNAASGPMLEDPWNGAAYPYVCANVVDAATGKPLLPPYVVKDVAGARIAFIGAVLKGAPRIVSPSGVAGLSFLDEAEAINAYVPELKAAGVAAIVALIHQGGAQRPYDGPTDQNRPPLQGDIADIVRRLDDRVDVVVSAHTHKFTNGLARNAAGRPVLVTQAYSYSSAFADITLDIDPEARKVTSATAAIVTAWGDAGPGLAPDAAAAGIAARADEAVAPLTRRVMGEAERPITRDKNGSGESALGDLVADAQRACAGADMAFTNPGGLRKDMDEGPLTWGGLFAIQPFGNAMVTMRLTGRQIRDLLAQQWANPAGARMLQVSGMGYTWRGGRPAAIVEVHDATGRPLADDASYTVAVNSFLADGGDGFTLLTQGADRTVLQKSDLDCLADFVSANSPLAPPESGPAGRITRQ